MHLFQKWYLQNARQNSNENRITDVMKRCMDRSDPEVLEYFLEATIMDRRKKSHEFPKEVLELCEEKDLIEYDKQIDDEEMENQEPISEERKSLLERLLKSTRTSDYNLRSRRLDAEESMDTN